MSERITGWNEHGHARKTGLPIDALLGRGDLQDAENCGYNPISVLATMRVKPHTVHGDPVDQFRAGRIELLDGTILERGGTLGAVWAVTQLPGENHA